MGGRHDEVFADAITNDLLGVRLFIRAALAGAPPSEPPGVMRKEPQRLQHEAGDLLQTVLVALGGDTRTASDGY